MSKDYSKFKEKYLDSLDVDNVTGEQMIERTNCLECDEYNHEKYYCPIFCDVIRQTVNEMQGWIPRTEQEPNIGEHILITVLWEKGVDTAFDNDYEVMEEDWGVGEYEIKNRTATPMVKRSHERMIAWMPMPKPYRGKEE